MVDLIDVETDRLQGFGELFQKEPRARQTLVVVAGLVQGVAAIHQGQLADLVAAHEEELGFQPGVQAPAAVAKARYLALQHVAAVIGMGLAVDMTDAHHPPVASLPRHRNQGGEIAPGHEVGSMGLHAHAADGETGETRSFLRHGGEAGHRHGLGLGGTMDVDELGQHVADTVLVDEMLGFAGQHDGLLG